MGEGSYLCAPGYNFFAGNGTSFATPILAGAVACLIQAHPTRSNMEILQALKATASQSATPDNNYGWGIPNVCAAHNYLITASASETLKKENIQLFPNPTHHQLSFTLLTTPESIEITDVLGKHLLYNLVTNANKYTIQFSPETPNGIYFISIKTSNAMYNSKFVKE